MNEFERNVTIVITHLKQRGFPEKTVTAHEKVYRALHSYLMKEGIHYTPKLGTLLLEENRDEVFGVKRPLARADCIARLNAIYTNGDFLHANPSSRRAYSTIVLSAPFEQAVGCYLDYCQGFFSARQLENTRWHCRRFLKCMQSWGRAKLHDISYGDILDYRMELVHLKQTSKAVEISSLYQFLQYSAECGAISHGRYLYMYLGEYGGVVHLKDLPGLEQRKIEKLRGESLSFPSEKFRAAGMELARLHLNEGYAPAYIRGFERAVLYLYLFLDLHGLGYLPEIAAIWLGSDAVKSAFHGGSWVVARRMLNVFRDFSVSGEAIFRTIYREGGSVPDELPEWCSAPIEGFAAQRLKQRLGECTVKNEASSLRRFCRFLIQSGLGSYAELTGELLLDFNREDHHRSPNGKNVCNGRIRRFLKYLCREGIAADCQLYLALGATAAPVETVVQTLTGDEVQAIKDYLCHAGTPLEIRDSAVMLLGSDMGIRGADIVSLKLSDIDWKNQCLRFWQNKTDIEIWLPMPAAVGNAIFRYLRDARPRAADSDYVFIRVRAPYRRLTRDACYATLKRILPDRRVHGSGFHVTRKTFATNRLQNRVPPAGIADALGHQGTGGLTPYLSLDGARMSECALPLEGLGIPMKGGFR